MSDGNKQNLHLVIRQREKTLFEGEVKALTSHSDKGVFDVIYEHANFISIVKKSCKIHKLDGTTSEVDIGEGILRVHENRVTVYLGIVG